MTVEPTIEAAEPQQQPASPNPKASIKENVSPMKVQSPTSQQRSRSSSPTRLQPSVDSMETNVTEFKTAPTTSEDTVPTESQPSPLAPSPQVYEPHDESSEAATKTAKSRGSKASLAKGRKSKKSVGPPLKSYVPGDYVWVKMKGYPTWPGKVLEHIQVPNRISKPNLLKTPKYPVLFFGTHDYGFHLADEMYPLDEFWDKFSKGSKKKDFVNAVTEAKEKREHLDALIERSLAEPESADFSASAESAEENELIESDDAMEAPRRKSAKKRKAEDDADETSVKRKKRSSTKDSSRKSQTAAEPTVERKSKRRAAAAEKEEVEDAENSKKSKSRPEVLLNYRHKLQKALAKKKDSSGNYMAADDIEWNKIVTTLENIENFNTDAALLKETKVLKVIKVILSTKYSIEVEHQLSLHGIREKCNIIMEKFNPILAADEEKTNGGHPPAIDEKIEEATMEVDSAQSTPPNEPADEVQA